MGPALDRLWQVIKSRRGADPETSYTARLFARGRAKIAQKLGEEAVEAVIEGVRGDRTKLVGESADLLYHLFVLWADTGRLAIRRRRRADAARRAPPGSMKSATGRTFEWAGTTACFGQGRLCAANARRDKPFLPSATEVTGRSSGFRKADSRPLI